MNRYSVLKFEVEDDSDFKIPKLDDKFTLKFEIRAFDDFFKKKREKLQVRQKSGKKGGIWDANDGILTYEEVRIRNCEKWVEKMK